MRQEGIHRWQRNSGGVAINKLVVENFKPRICPAGHFLRHLRNKFSMTYRFGFPLFVIPNLIRDLGFGFEFVLNPAPLGGVLHFAEDFFFFPSYSWLIPFPINATKTVHPSG